MNDRNNHYEHGLTPEKEPIPLILPSIDDVRKYYGDDAAEWFDANKNASYEHLRNILINARSGTLGSITDTTDSPIPLPGNCDFTVEERRPLHERRKLLRILARRISDAVVPTLQEYKQRYKNDISKAQEELLSAIITPLSEKQIREKIAVRALELHMLDTLLNGDALTWKAIKALADADDRCDALSEANKENIFVEYMKTCIHRELITPASA